MELFKMGIFAHNMHSNICNPETPIPKRVNRAYSSQPGDSRPNRDGAGKYLEVDILNFDCLLKQMEQFKTQPILWKENSW